MKIIYGISNIRKLRSPVVALGVFDGVHRGHINILKATVLKARRIKGTGVVVTFWPHPQGEESLYSLEHRLKLIARIGVDVAIVIRFNRAFARITAEDFIEDILVERIGAEYIYVGKNFRFGRGARGDFRLLGKLSRLHGFKLKIFSVVRADHHPISSTLIRRLIKKGKIAAAQRLLSRPVSVLGTVIHGASLARKLGVRTANIDPHHEVLPPSGVYAVKVILEDKEYYGVCSIGTKPTFNQQGIRHIEVHLFDFQGNIYGKYLEILFVKKIREQKKFPSHTALAKAINNDIILTRSLFSLP